MPANLYANQPFLQNSMTQLLAYGSNNTFVGKVSQSGTILTVDSTTSGSVAVGSLISITGHSTVSVLASSGANWIVNLSQTVSQKDATASSYTVQNLLSNFLNGITSANYGLLVSAINVAEDSIRNATYGTAPGCALRTLVTTDDGTVAIDTSRTTNLYINFSKKITIADTAVDSNNAFKVTNSDPSGTGTLTVGTAGGNNINENHMSRPELLLACLSSNGTGFTSRFSTSIQANSLYYATRVGLTTQEPNGFIRLSVPSVV